jgi:hypothetical protein
MLEKEQKTTDHYYLSLYLLSLTLLFTQALRGQVVFVKFYPLLWLLQNLGRYLGIYLGRIARNRIKQTIECKKYNQSRRACHC